MNRESENVKILQILALLTLGGIFAVGSLANVQTTKQPPVVASPTTAAQRNGLGPLEMMKRSLSLTDEQARKLEPVLKEQQDKLNGLRRDTSLSRKDRMAKLKEVQQGTDAKIKAQLTPEQAAKWQQVRANPSRFMQPPGQNPARTNAFSLGSPGGSTQPALPAWQSRSPRPGQSQPRQAPPAQQPAQAVSPK